MKHTKAALVTATLMVLAGCASPAFDSDNENAARNRGAAGGVLLGATVGALTGDAGLAAKTAVAGGVAGGVAGSMKDLDDSRSSSDTKVLADGVSQDHRSDAEKRVAELEAEIRIRELEEQLAEAEKENKANNDKNS
ncbi:glycine zipper family protein [Vibrio sp. E150_011]|uniref:glycine zipper family protein n=1 Tax=Vibrio sp. 10N.261.51.F12 TaxID=3229679 RepID=UPI003556AA1A